MMTPEWCFCGGMVIAFILFIPIIWYFEKREKEEKKKYDLEL